MPAAADKVKKLTVGGREISLPLPPDSCDLDPVHQRDRVLITGLDAIDSVGNRPRPVLRRFASCNELALWRNGKRDAAPELVEIVHLPADGKPADRAEWLKSVRERYAASTGEKLAADWSKSAPALPEQGGQARYTTPILLDDDRDERALYGATLLRLQLGGRPVLMAGVISWTMVAEQPVVTLALSPWEGDGTIIGWLSEEQRDLMDRLLSLNGEDRRRFARAEKSTPDERRDPEERQRRDLLSRYATELGIGLVAGGFLLIVIGVIGNRTLRRRAA